MNPNRSSFVPIEQKMNQQKALQDGSRQSSRSCIWDDMQGWMDQRQREWDDEMAQLKNEFFSIKSDKLTSRRSSSDSSSLPEKMNIASRIYDTASGCKMFCVTFDVSRFEPEEVNVRTQANSLIVHAKHEEQRENKSVSREFNRCVDIPSHINPQTLRCFIRDDGTLRVEAELPSSYESSSINRDSPFALENSSTFSDRLSDRDICSPPRTDMDVCSPSGTERDIFSPSATYRDIYCPPRHGGDVLSPSRKGDDLYSPFKSHWIDDIPLRNDKDSYCYQKARGNISTPRSIDDLQQTARDIYSPSRIDNDIDNSQRIARDIFSPTSIDTTSSIRPTLHNPQSMLDGSRFSCPTTDVVARNGQARPTATENGHTDDSGMFSVVIDIGTGFEPHELAVQTVDRKLVVHARHTSQHFGYGEDIYREYDLPEGVDPGSIMANLTPEGILIIEAPINTWPYTAEPRDLPYPRNF